MEFSVLFEYAQVAWREIRQRKFKVAFAIALLSFLILLVGMFKPLTYSSAVTIYADNQNIIKPLLGKQAEVTRVKQNRTTQVRDIIYSPRQLTKLIRRIYGADAFAAGEQLEKKQAEIREKLTVEGLSGNYIKISYQDDTADNTFRLLNEVVVLFIEDIANTKRQESRSAFSFIEQQVTSYKEQLLRAESKLKDFKSTNLDGTESEVLSRISALRATIEELKIQQSESTIRLSSLRTQLADEDKFAANDYEELIYHTRLKKLEHELSALLLVYKAGYPEVVEVKFQIADLKTIIASLNSQDPPQQNLSNEFSPLYKELRSKLATAEVDQRTLINRQKSFDFLLKQAHDRRKRIANNQAELAELNRDYSVTQTLYQDMLANKEKARLSMVLDIAGQGVNYKIQEPATYPTVPSGPRFLHFVIAGPFVAFILLFSVFVARILIDGRIRFASQLRQLEGATLLVTIGHTINKTERKKRRIQNTILATYAIFGFAIYLTTAVSHKYGFSAIQQIVQEALINAVK